MITFSKKMTDIISSKKGRLPFICAALSFLIIALSSPTGATNINVNGGLTPADFVRDIQTGQLSVPFAGYVLEQTTDFNSSEAQEFVENLARINDSENAGKIVEDLVAGRISEGVASSLSELIDIGGNQNVPGGSVHPYDLEDLIEGTGLRGPLGAMLEGAADIDEAVDTLAEVIDLVGGEALISRFATAGVAESFAEQLEELFPTIVEAFGGVDALANALNSAAGGPGGISTATGPGTTSGDDSGHSRCQCQAPISQNHRNIRSHVTSQFSIYRQWFLSDMFIQNILPAWQLITNQLTSVGMMQVTTVGQFFDAKHQLETQRVFQTLTAEAHKDYHPSEAICTFGTNMRSLAASERRSDLTNTALAKRGMDRQMSRTDGISMEGAKSDRISGFRNFVTTYCRSTDAGGAYARLCPSIPDDERANKDVNITQTIEDNLTLEIDFSDASVTDDEADVMALMNNLFAHNVLPNIANRLLVDGNGEPNAVAKNYLDIRSIAAKRSVAQNSISSITALRASGEPGSTPYLYKLMEDLGIGDDQIVEILGDNPSYFAQMEVLTKYIYQNPDFYTDLYDKPVNVDRKGAVLQAISLMQDRDTFDSLMRSEMALATLLETLLLREHRRIAGNLNSIANEGPVN